MLLIKIMRNSEFQIDVNVCLKGQAQRGEVQGTLNNNVAQNRLPNDYRLHCSFGLDTNIIM